MPCALTGLSFHKEKVDGLPRPWPLLHDRQEPDELSARVAFHLHRIGISTTALQAGGFSRLAARDLRQARLLLELPDVAWLGASLALNLDDLARPLTVIEQLDWAFYRTSARHSQQTWQRVKALAAARGLSLRETATVLKQDSSHIRRVVSGKSHTPTLLRPPALWLADALHMESGPEAFIDGLPRYPRRD